VSWFIKGRINRDEPFLTDLKMSLPDSLYQSGNNLMGQPKNTGRDDDWESLSRLKNKGKS
jgi:hypothetical protein